MKKYSENLKDPRWQKKRLEVMQRDDFHCAECGAGDSTLAVHHLYYVSGRKPWQYPMWSLSTLCEHCHDVAHYPEDECETDHIPQTEWESLIGFLGIRKPRDFGSVWDMGVEVAMLQSALGGGVFAWGQFSDWLESEARAWRNKIETSAATDTEESELQAP